MIGIEAMRHARPVIAFASGGIPEWIHDRQHGRLVKTGDVYALRDAIVDLLENPDKTKAYGENASRWVQENFSFKDYIENLKDLLMKLSR